jgi:hypothetical protein
MEESQWSSWLSPLESSGMPQTTKGRESGSNERWDRELRRDVREPHKWKRNRNYIFQTPNIVVV